MRNTGYIGTNDSLSTNLVISHEVTIISGLNLIKAPDGTGSYYVMRHEGAHISISLPFPFPKIHLSGGLTHLTALQLCTVRATKVQQQHIVVWRVALEKNKCSCRL